MTERDITKLLKLLQMFRVAKLKDGTEANTAGEGQIINVVSQWVKWYGRDALDMDL